MARERLLLIDPDDTLRVTLADALTDVGWIVRVAASCEQARTVIATLKPDVVIFDERVPAAARSALVHELRTGRSAPELVLLSTPEKTDALAAILRSQVPATDGESIPPVSRLTDADVLARTLTAAA